MAKDFSKQVRAFSDKAVIQSTKHLKNVAMEMFTRVVMRSPVDTGRFRSNWMLTINADTEATRDDTDPSGMVAYGAALAAMEAVKLGDRIVTQNNLPYAERLENGWSKQAPTGMVALTVQEYPAIVAAMAAVKDD